MAERLVNNELERTRKNMVVTYFKLQQGLRNITNNFCQYSLFLAKVRTEHLPHISVHRSAQ
jgi:hypothetical protein